MKTEKNTPITPLKLRQIIGDNIRCFRNKLRWSQEKLGREAGLHNDFIGRVERGSSTIGVDNLHKLATIFGVNTAWLLVKDYCFRLHKLLKKMGYDYFERI